jgi:hypothetical protein
MKARFLNETDDWSTNGAKITSAESLTQIQRILEDEAPIIVEHRFYRGACAPARMVFDDFEEFTNYLKTSASAGDAIYVWNFGATCTDENVLVKGKCPDDYNRVPQKGAY